MIALLNILFLVRLFVPVPNDTLLERGKKLVAEGKPGQLLDEWSEVLNRSEAASTLPPEAGMIFIEWVTGLGRRDLDELACKFYFQSIEAAALSDTKVLRDELERLLPLLHRKEQERWIRLASDSTIQLAKEIRRFWEIKDDIAATVANEALLRHWSRIFEARSLFTKNEKPPYGTDDRGIIYVRYGQPFQKKVVAAVVSEIRDPFTQMPMRLRLGGMIAVEVEIWRYRLAGLKEPILFYFAENKDENKPFGLIVNLADAVPTRGVGPIGMLGATKFVPNYQARDLLRFAALQALGERSPETADFYQQLESQIITYGRTAPLVRTVNSALPSFDNRLETEFKTRERELPKLSPGKLPFETMSHFNASTYNLFADDGSPVFAVAVTSSIESAEKSERKRLSLESQEPMPVLIRYALKEIQSDGSTVMVHKSIEQNGGQAATMFLLSSASSPENVLASAEWFSLSRVNMLQIRDEDPYKIKKLLLSASGPRPLTYRPAENVPEMEVSDLVIGTLNRGDNQERFPVIPVLKPILSASDTLFVYFEVAKTPATVFQVEVHVQKSIKSKDLIPAITLNYQRTEKVSREFFELPLKNLKRGEYQLNMIFRSANRKLTRSGSIVVDI